MSSYKGLKKDPVISKAELVRNQRFVKNILDLLNAYEAERKASS